MNRKRRERGGRGREREIKRVHGKVQQFAKDIAKH